jgi:peptidoglycan-N-acetylglucosamine deacetylase
VPRHIVCLTFDFDTMSGFIARGLTTLTMLSRGEFGARAASRILAFLESRGIRSTWFTPGFTIESWPRECEAVVKAGHEIGHHSWAHVPPANQSRDEEEADLVRANDAIVRLTGRSARGYRSPSWDLSPHTVELLVRHGFVYDSSLMGDDFTPYRPRIGDEVSTTEPLRRGREARLWELPMCFELDDWPHFQFAFGPPYRAGLSAPSKVLEIWTEEFDWMDRHVDGGLLTVCMHPQVIGRGHRMAMLERFVEHCADAGASFARMGDVARDLG